MWTVQPKDNGNEFGFNGSFSFIQANSELFPFFLLLKKCAQWSLCLSALSEAAFSFVSDSCKAFEVEKDSSR